MSAEDDFINKMITDVQNRVSQAYEIGVAPPEDVEVIEFWCDTWFPDVARHARKVLVDSMEADDATKKAILELPLNPRMGLPKYRLMAMGANGQVIFSINTKTGESYHL